MNNLKPKLKRFLRVLLRKLSRCLFYIDVFVLLAALIWSGFFARNYFLKIRKDFEFINDNISNISYTRLDKDEFEEVFKRYEEKTEYNMQVPNYKHQNSNKF